MNFTPKPKNEFKDFMQLYYRSCRENIPQIEALAAKWEFEDLIPGMSDYDTRFIYKDGMTVDDWCEASMAIGQVHLDICNKYPRWARILEHLPGINITWDEYLDERKYYPEYHQWTVYDSENPAKLKESETYLANHEWNESDEYFFLKKFLLYYSRYDRNIDPPINLGAFENKYALHSRFMHYFDPPVQSAVCILLKRVIRGKVDAVKEAKKLFPEIAVFDELLNAVDKHYEMPQLCVEPDISELEERLYDALTEISKKLAPSITIIEGAQEKSPAQWKAELADFKPDPLLKVFDNTKWARQMKGRLYFYANAPAHFDSELCIAIELNRINNMFFAVPYRTFWELKTGQSDKDLLEIVEEVRGDLLTDKQADSTIKYHQLTSQKWPREKYKEVALMIVDVYEDFYRGLHNIIESSYLQNY